MQPAVRRLLLSKAVQRVPEGLETTKNYRLLAAKKRTAAEARQKKEAFAKYPLRYQILQCPPGLPLAITKVKYLLACRRTHPDAGGDAEAFLRVNLAFQDVMKDYGVETVDNKIVNLGNFQTGDHEMQNYLSARAQITSYIPIATLEDHLRQIEEVENRLGPRLAEKLSGNDDETMWLLEDIEDMMEQTGLKTVRLKMLENGKVQLVPNRQLTDGTEKPLFLTASEKGDEGGGAGGAASRPAVASAPAADHEARGEDIRSGEESGAHVAEPATHDSRHTEAEVSTSDIAVLNARNTLQDRFDVAGLAARTATEVMNNTQEVKQIKLEGAVLYVLLASVFVAVFVYFDGMARARRQIEARPEVAAHLQADTMLPWWGNDAEYESQVKRIFVEEWRQARANSRRAQTFQDGVVRESLDADTKKDLDLKVFTVTADRLREMREHAEKYSGRR